MNTVEFDPHIRWHPQHVSREMRAGRNGHRRIGEMANLFLDAGIITYFTGISAPYQARLTPDLVVDTDQIGIEESVMAVLALLHQRGVIERNSSGHAL